jgi:hypothetical protein
MAKNKYIGEELKYVHINTGGSQATTAEAGSISYPSTV